jgi:phytoene synthase
MSDAAPSDATDLDAQVREQDPDRWLASRFIGDAQARADVIAILAFDHELARAPRVASNALLGEIRLTWWREALDEAFGAGPVRRHPVAQALADVVRRRRLERVPLEEMNDARHRELDPTPMGPDEAVDWARRSAGAAAVLSAQILDPHGEPEAARSAGAAWMLRRAEERGAVAAYVVAAEFKAAQAEARRLSVAAFPAAAHGALARKGARSALAKRLRLVWAVLRGRI